MRKLIVSMALGLFGLIEGLGQGAVDPSNAKQTLEMVAGWNLLTIQLQPSDASPGAVFGVGGNQIAVERVWSFDNATKTWKSWVNPAMDPAGAAINQIPSTAIERVTFGQSYWVKAAQAGSLEVLGDIPDEAPPVVVYPGWNLVGVPVAGVGFQAVPSNAISILSVLGIPELTFNQLVRWQSGAPTPDNRNVGFNVNQLGSPEGSDFQFFDPERPIWLFSEANATVTIRPELTTLARGDLNFAPSRFPGPEDLVISGQNEPVDARSIRRVVFFEKEDAQRISLLNPGGGVLSWEAEWIGVGATIDAVGLSANPLTPDAPEVSPRIAGVVASGKANIHLNVDRNGLSPNGSPHFGILRLRTSAGSEPIDFETWIHVPPLKGDWSGEMTVKTVNGNSNAVPSPDLHVSFYEDAKAPGVFRGIIDASASTFWPVDVPVFGYLTGQDANSFVLSGSYYLPPGDRNVPPFSVFDPATTKDIDWNGDGRLDHINPFPFPILRTVSLTGKLVAASSMSGYKIEGKFIDVVHGMLREAIQVEGSFELNRSSIDPFYKRDGVMDTIAGSPAFDPALFSEVREAIPIFDSRTITFPAFQTDLDLANVRLTGRLRRSDGRPLESAAVVLRLQSPDGRSVILHDASEVDAELLSEFDYPVSTAVMDPADQAWNQFIAGVELGKGAWQLIADNQTGTTVELYNLRLVVAGQPLMDVVGRVVDVNGNPVAGAVVSTSGMPFSFVLDQQGGIDQRTNAHGVFEFKRLSAMPFNFTAQLPGMNSPARLTDARLTPRFDFAEGSVGAEMAATFRPFPLAPPAELGLTGFHETGDWVLQFEESAGTDRLSVGPLFGQAPLTVQLSAGDPVSPNWSMTRLDFSGNPLVPTTISTQTSDEYVFESPGVYQVRYKGGQSFQIIVTPSPGHVATPSQVAPGLPAGMVDQYAADGYVFSARFAGGGSLPVDVHPEIMSVDAPAPFVGLFMLQHTYAASMDIDLAPHTSFGNAFGDDSMRSFPPLPSAEYWAVDPINRNATVTEGDPGWDDEDHNYFVTEEAWYFEPTPNFRYEPGMDVSLSAQAGLNRSEAIYHDFRRDDPGREESPPIVNTKALGYQDTTNPNNPKQVEVTSYQMACHIGGHIIAVGSLSGAVTEAPGAGTSVRNLQQQRSLSAGGAAGSANRIYTLNLNPFAP